MVDRAVASTGCEMGYEDLSIYLLCTKKDHIAPFVRGQLRSILNTGQRRRALINAVESDGLPHQEADPAGTSGKCIECGGKLTCDTIQQTRNRRDMWYQ